MAGPIVSLLSELPNSLHDPQSFGVDLTLFTDKLIHLTVTGMFKERKQGGSNELVRSFQRTLVIVPSGGGFCIKNEAVHFSNATPMQEKTLFVPRPTVETQNTITPPNNTTGTFNDDTKREMVTAMSNQSGMNLDWSRKCLEETQWDFQRAAFVFSELQKQNKIPPEAFVK